MPKKQEAVKQVESAYKYEAIVKQDTPKKQLQTKHVSTQTEPVTQEGSTQT